MSPRRARGNRRYRHVDLTVRVPVRVTLLVSNIPDDIDNPDGLPDEWDVERVISYGDPDISKVVRELTDEQLTEIDALASQKKDIRYNE